MSNFYAKIEKEFSELLKSHISELVVDISKEFGLDEEQLKNFINGRITKPTQKKIGDFFVKEEKKEEVKKVEKKAKKEEKPEEVDKEALANDKDLDIRKLLNYSLAELKALCKRYNLKQTGKKDELIKRLQGKEGETEEEKKEVKKKSPTKKEKESNDTKTLKKIENNAPVINVRRNEHGNLMHVDSGLVMDKETKTFYGKQLSDGRVADLTQEDIETCKMYNLNYRLPENLDKNKRGLDDIKIDEMESDEEKVDDKTDKVMKALVSDDKEEKKDEEEYEEVEYEEEYEYEEVEVEEEEA